jgi:adenosylmethionine-8-amino-7-oxononanoate aminotransferase
MSRLAKLDQQYVWHPFTQMLDWLRQEPIVIVEGRGTVLRDDQGREYLDANASIWTNLHGHQHPRINAAIRRQLKKIAHSSALGFANEPASLLAARLVETARSNHAWPDAPAHGTASADPTLEKVFFGDDGSTALEVALKLAYEFTRRTRGAKTKPRFLSLAGAYHGDTIGAVSLGHIDLFHQAYGGLLFKTDRVMAPYCYRCPFNRAKPRRDDARNYRQCDWECVGQVERRLTAQLKKSDAYAAFVFEPLIQGAAGMIAQPDGWLPQVARLAREHGALLIADEVMTGFGRTGNHIPTGNTEPGGQVGNDTFAKAGCHPAAAARLFATGKVGVAPDFLCLAKGLTGGYLPMSATLTTQKVFDAFLGEYEEFKTFFHGHSFTGNQLGAAASLTSLDLLQSPASIRARAELEKNLHAGLQTLWSLPIVGDIRQVGLVAGIELVRDWRTREAFLWQERMGIRVCEAMARRGVLTRPVGNVIVLMPPYCTTPAQLQQMVSALAGALREMR